MPATSGRLLSAGSEAPVWTITTSPLSASGAAVRRRVLFDHEIQVNEIPGGKTLINE
jgi:hypothetical protein